MHFTPRSPAAWGWGCRFVGLSSTPMGAGCGQRRMNLAVRYFSSPCPPRSRPEKWRRLGERARLLLYRPFGVKRFQTIHHHSVDVAHGLVLLFGIGTKALPVWDSKTRRNNLSGGLAVSRRQNQADMRTHLIHRPARDIFHCSVELGFPPIELILWTPHAAAASLVQRNSVPSTHMRCMITANRRAKATIAFFIPRRLAICMAQALSHDHLFESSML